MAASERVSVLVFVSGWRQAGACIVQRHAFRAYRFPHHAPRTPLTEHGHEHAHGHGHEPVGRWPSEPSEFPDTP